MYLTRNIHDFSSLISYWFDGVIYLWHFKSLRASLSLIWRICLRLFVSICTDRLWFEYFHTIFSKKKSCKCFTHRTLTSLNFTNLLSRICSQCFHRKKLGKMFRSPKPDYLIELLWRIFRCLFFNLQKCFVWISTFSFHRKKIVKMFRTRHSLNKIWSLPGLLSTVFFNLQSFDFFPHKVFTENLVKMFRFGHGTSLTGVNWLKCFSQ
jgi:hypothetical protein